MASNATPAKIAATKAYGAEVVLHGRSGTRPTRGAGARPERGLTIVHPFDDMRADRRPGNGRARDRRGRARRRRGRRPDRRRRADLRRPAAIRTRKPEVRVSASSRPARRHAAQPRAGDARHARQVECSIDGLKVKRVGEKTFALVSSYVDGSSTSPDSEIFDASSGRCRVASSSSRARPPRQSPRCSTG